MPLPSQRSSIPKTSYSLLQNKLFALSRFTFGIRYGVTLLREIKARSWSEFHEMEKRLDVSEMELSQTVDREENSRKECSLRVLILRMCFSKVYYIWHGCITCAEHSKLTCWHGVLRQRVVVDYFSYIYIPINSCQWPWFSSPSVRINSTHLNQTLTLSRNWRICIIWIEYKWDRSFHQGSSFSYLSII